MHELEPFYRWRDYYIADEDKYSPFYGREYSEFVFSTTIYNYYIHPQWDEIGSPTLFCKLIFADYTTGFAVLEFIGEWNDCIHNDIMYLKRNVIEKLQGNGINKFLLIGENILNFHASDDCYYEEWFEEVYEESGWLIAIGFRDHVAEEMRRAGIHHYLLMGAHYELDDWRTYQPNALLQKLDNQVLKTLS